MKNRIFILFFFVIGSSAPVFCQLEFGMKAGISSFQLGDKSIAEWTGQGKFFKQFTEAEYGHHFGLYTRFKIVNFYVEPAVMFQSSSFSYMLEEYSEAGVIQILKNDRYNQVQIPVLLGLQLGFLRLQGGPVANVHINKTSDIWDFGQYEEKFNTFQYGLQVGAGVDIWRFRFDVLYENNISSAGGMVNIGGRDFLLNPNPSRILMTLGYKF